MCTMAEFVSSLSTFPRPSRFVSPQRPESRALTSAVAGGLAGQNDCMTIRTRLRLVYSGLHDHSETPISCAGQPPLLSSSSSATLPTQNHSFVARAVHFNSFGRRLAAQSTRKAAWRSSFNGEFHCTTAPAGIAFPYNCSDAEDFSCRRHL